MHHDLADRLSGYARIGFAYNNSEIETSGFELIALLGADPFGVGDVRFVEAPTGWTRRARMS